MSQDVKIEEDEEGIFDIPMVNGDLATIDGLETALGTSVFTDKRADAGVVPEAFNRRGWGGNILTKIVNFELGSVMWLLEQSRLDQDALNRSKDYIQDALQWALTTGVADTIDVSATKTGEQEAKLDVSLFKELTLVKRYSTLWVNTRPI